MTSRCRQCGVVIPSNEDGRDEPLRGRPRIYCSKRCGKEFHASRARKPKPTACVRCGIELQHTSRQWSRYCSTYCRVRHSKDARKVEGRYPLPTLPKPPRDLICTQCGEKFSQSGKGKNRLVCYADVCVKEKRQADSRTFHERRKADGRMVVLNDRRRKHEPRPCRDCGRTLRIGQRCRDCSHALRKAIGGPSGQAEARLRVFERDNWACRLCGGHIDADLTYPDPMSPSIDHVVPLSVAYERHGLDFEDTEDNWQAAHYVCNTSKGARVAS